MTTVPVKVSVVIATYNSGPELDRVVASLDGQSLPRNEYEVIFVDDGSTDDTYHRLNEIARERPNVSVHRIPNSGWPGRPRNVGTAAARGEYVLYMDHDDDIFPEALERMYDYAAQNSADVLLGKEVMFGDGRTPGWPTWRANQPDAEVGHALLHCMTPHKLYRRALIESVPLRFPEGNIRLEDQYWNAAAYAAGRRFAILADYPCYRWQIHPGNSHRAKVDLDVYLSSFYASLAPIEALLPGPRRDELLKRPYVRVVLVRMSSDNGFRSRFRTDAAEIASHFPPSLDRLLEPVDRLRSALFRRQDWATLNRLSPFYVGFTLRMRDTTARWEEAGLRIRTTGAMVLGDGTAYPVERRDGGIRLRLPVGIPERQDEAVVDLDDALTRAYVDLSVHARSSGVEWPVPATFAFEVVGEGADCTLEFRVEGVLDPRTGAMGRELDDDLWDVMVQFSALGHEVRRRVPASDMPDQPAVFAARAAVASSVAPGNLALDLTPAAESRLGNEAPVLASPARETATVGRWSGIAALRDRMARRVRPDRTRRQG